MVVRGLLQPVFPTPTLLTAYISPSWVLLCLVCTKNRQRKIGSHSTYGNPAHLNHVWVQDTLTRLCCHFTARNLGCRTHRHQHNHRHQPEIHQIRQSCSKAFHQDSPLKDVIPRHLPVLLWPNHLPQKPAAGVLTATSQRASCTTSGSWNRKECRTFKEYE